jgi:hypothetical protein
MILRAAKLNLDIKTKFPFSACKGSDQQSVNNSFSLLMFCFMMKFNFFVLAIMSIAVRNTSASHTCKHSQSVKALDAMDMLQTWWLCSHSFPALPSLFVFQAES